MKKNKIKLDQLTVKSFVTDAEKINLNTIKGGFQDIDTVEVETEICSLGCPVRSEDC